MKLKCSDGSLFVAGDSNGHSLWLKSDRVALSKSTGTPVSVVDRGGYLMRTSVPVYAFKSNAVEHVLK